MCEARGFRVALGLTLGRHSHGHSHCQARRIAGGGLLPGRDDATGQFHAIHQGEWTGAEHGAVPQIAGGRRLSIPRRGETGDASGKAWTECAQIDRRTP